MSASTSQLASVTPVGTHLVPLSRPSASITITAATISALASDNSYNDSGNGFVAAGFAVRQRVRVTGFTGNVANNIAVGVITALTAGKMTIGGTDGDVIVDDAAGESVTITAWESVRATVQALLDLILDAPPGALDTLNELAAALGDDANFATTVTNALALKAPLASPALTGNPTVPTQSPGDNSTKAASTAYVEAAVAAGGGGGGGAADGAHTADTQAWQSKKYLMRDGQWRDPLVLGTGILAVGSIATVTDDSSYNSWPQACRLRDGRLMIAYNRSAGHNTDNSGRTVGKIATENLDGTLTWGSEFEIYNHASLVSVPYGLAQISTGRIFASIQQYDIAVTNYSAIIVYSDDDGATWSSPIDLTPTSGLTVGALCSGRVVEMRDGSLRQLVEGSASSLTTRSTRIMSSTDGGATWGDPVYVHNYATDSVIAVEPDLLLLDDGSLLAIWRTSATVSTHAASRSTDGGATWGAKFNIFGGWGAPRMIQASTGTLIAITRANSGAAGIAFTSMDRGATWDAGTVFDSTMTEFEYGCPVEMRDGRVLVVYGEQPTGSTSDSNIKVVPLTETKVKAGLIVIPIAVGDESTAATTGAGKLTFRMPCALILKPGGQGVRASAKTAPTGASFVIDINEDTGGGATTILSTKLSIDASEKTSATAATPAVISDRALADDAEITIDFDQVGSTVAGAGIKVSLIGWEPA
jgi:hypothetical protein